MALKAFLVVFKNWEGRALLLSFVFSLQFVIVWTSRDVFFFFFISTSWASNSTFWIRNFFFCCFISVAEKGGVCWLSYCIKSIRNSFKIIAVKGKRTSCPLLWSILMDLKTIKYIYFVSICRCKDRLNPFPLALTNFMNIHHYGGFWTSYLNKSL